jgi:hypothetical protein
MGLTLRQEWFKNRIKEIINELNYLENEMSWIRYKEKSHELACELLYATTEWDKYYRNINE